MRLKNLLELLNYDKSENYRDISKPSSPAVSHLFRSAARANVKGAYFFQSSPKNQEILPARVAAYVAEADTPEQAREIHRKVWNLGNAPFLIVVLPNQFRIYTGFDYEQDNDESGLLDTFPMYSNLIGEVDFATEKKLNVFSADSIDSGTIWENTAQKINLARRVDRRLLTDLAQLEKEIVGRLELDLKNALQIAHALIGKYIYIKYLRDRNILSSEWVEEEGISLRKAIGREATFEGLGLLSEAIEARFNGDIFPFPKENSDAIKDDIVSLVAGVFEGDTPYGQLHLNFQAYDFSYIPVETLSEIYEQFLRSEGTGKLDGAIYTPEPLADYLICELNSIKQMRAGMKVLDPCCGSGIFLVLTYQRLIEQELAEKGALSPQAVRRILLDSIYGVERNEDACRVTELSLILTMLNYIEPPQLHKNKDFKFPVLHNNRIFNSDFFDNESAFWKQREKFDYIIGNPPWIQPSSRKDAEKEKFVLQWFDDNRDERPVAKNRVAEAFSWRVTDLVNTDDGCIGLILHAKSLFNHLSKNYRKAFFEQHEVFRITNFSNLAYILFDGRGQAPAYTIVYKTGQSNGKKPNIIHFAPLVANQVSSRAWIKRRKHRKPWTITINEDEIKTIDAHEATKGDALTWKLAMWGTHRDERIIKRLRSLFKDSLQELTLERKWELRGGVRLRNSFEVQEDESIKPAPELRGWKVLMPEAMNHSDWRFQVPEFALRDILDEECNTDVQAGDVGLKVAYAPHIVLNINYFAFSDDNFIITKPHIGLSGPADDADYLRAIAVYLNSSFSQYLMFWENAGWGVERSQIGSAKDIETIPLPSLSEEETATLARLFRKAARMETGNAPPEKIREFVDDEIQKMFDIPDYIRVVVEEFLQIRLGLNKGKTTERAVERPDEKDLLAYAKYLKKELDDFAYDGDLKHDVSIIYSPNLIVCEVKLTTASAGEDNNGITIAKSNRKNESVLTDVSEKLKRRSSQWVYVQRGMRIFEPSRVYICKTPRLIDWTKTQAMLDARDIIAEVSSEKPYLNSGASNVALATN